MSTSDYKAPLAPVPNSTYPSSSPNDLDIKPSPDSSHFDSQMLIKVELSPETSVSSPGFTADAPNHESQSTNPTSDLELPPEFTSTSFGYMCGNSRQANLFLFTPDGNFTSLSPHILDIKDLDKGDNSSSAILSSRPLSNSSLSASSNASPKPFMALHLNETKNDKMLSGFDGRVDGLSPLSVIAVSAYQDAGHPSPNLLSRGHPVLRYHPGGDAMLSALNYSESDMLQEGGFDVPSAGAFSALDGLLGTGIGGANSSGIPDLLDGDISQETYMETGQDLRLSPQSFTTAGDSFVVSESTSLGSLNDTGDALGITTNTRESNKIAETPNLLAVDKLKVKNCRPAKATSPSRPGTQPCPTCGKVFSNSSALTKHKLTHSDERKYVCPLCAKAFKRQDHLNGHMLTHRNKKPFECDAEGCGKSYCDARSLRRHKENHHSTPATGAATTAVSVAASLSVPAVGKQQVTVIPGLAAHLANLSSLHSSFPASVITSNSNPLFNAESTAGAIGNRIQYAPPPAVATTAPSSHSQAVSKEENDLKTPSVIGSMVSPNTKLQYLTYQTQESRSPLQSGIVTTAVITKTENTVLAASWPAQTINTGALLLTQNIGLTQRPQNSAQVITGGGFNLSSSDQDNKKLNLDLTTFRASSLVPDHNQKNLSEDSKKDGSPSGMLSSNEFTEKGLEMMKLESNEIDATPVSSTTSKMNAIHTGSEVKISNRDNELSLTSVPKKNTDCLQIQSPLLQQLLNQQHQRTELGGSITQGYSDLPFISVLSAKQVSQAEVATSSTTTSMAAEPQILIPHWSTMKYTIPQSTATNNRQASSQNPKPVECSLCQRKFKNIPALNGHMRLHGGYFKKENDGKKCEKKSNATSHSPLTTASTNVRALIEEKIIQKRNFGTQNITNHLTENASPSYKQVFEFQPMEITEQATHPQPFIAQTSAMMSPLEQDTPVFEDFPVTSQNSSPFDSVSAGNSLQSPYDWLKGLNLKQPFRVPHPPSGEKHRRHSDSDHFIPAKRPCTSSTNSALANLLRRKVVAKRTSRTGSDPGQPLALDSLPFSDLSSSSSSLSLDFLPKFTRTFSSSLQNTFSDVVSDLQREELSANVSEDSILPILSAEDIPDAQPHIKDDMDSHSLDKTTFFDTSSTNLNMTQPFPNITVSELEMMQLTTPVTSVSIVPPSTGVHAIAMPEKQHSGEDSNDDDVFLSPTSLPTSPLKTKRKHRPEPLYIPPYVNTCGFTSRLRSPRLWDPSHMDHKKLSPPPYTPPPMLSPVRSGSGLFWHIISGSGSLTPKSAPITPSFGYPRKSSVGDYATEEEEPYSEAPESDILPHVNIGSYYQAKLPRFNSNLKEALFCDDKADKVWDPVIMESLTEEEVDAYESFACSASIPGCGNNKEYSLHLLHISNGKIQDAILSMMNSNPKLPSNHFLLKFKYSESDKWSTEEIEAYHQGLLKCDKDFYTISKEIPGKNIKQCVEFYYVWKKVCPEDYKRIRMIRRRKEQESLYYNLRTKDGESSSNQTAEFVQENGTEDVAENHYLMDGQRLVQTNCNTEFPKMNSVTTSTCVPTSNSISNTLSSTTAYDFLLEPVEEFPCKVCGKVFSKVKSRSAHMKSHRQPDNDKK